MDQFQPDPAAAARLRAALGLGGRFVAIYAGIHGVAQGLETLVEAAAPLKDTPDIGLVFVGEGPRKAEVRRLMARAG